MLRQYCQMKILRSTDRVPDIDKEADICLVPASHRESQDLLHPVMERLRAGERGAIRELFELTAPTLFPMVREVLLHSAAADEVITDVYVQASRTAAQYDSSRVSVITWLLMICRSRVIERYRADEAVRKHTSSGYLGKAVSQPKPPDASANVVQYANPANGIEGSVISPSRLLNLAFFRGLGRNEIAAETELALGTVKTHLRLALSSLRTEMQAKLADTATQTASDRS
jgi:RNA polymerase sigma-70 factor, ECF subfamily